MEKFWSINLFYKLEKRRKDVACDGEGDPTCPVCRSGTPFDFHPLPWWRDDLVKEADSDARYEWNLKPIEAEPGKPRNLPSVNAN